MSFNPFKEKALKIEESFDNWKNLYLIPYDNEKVDPYTRARIILAEAMEFEAINYTHQFLRHCNNDDIRRSITLMRRSEQQQQKRIASLIPINEMLLTTAVGYEQLEVDLTALLAQSEMDSYLKSAYDYALIEDLDHLYRFSAILQLEHDEKAENIVGGYTEIMPGRPSISEHRFPFDDVRCFVRFSEAGLQSKLNIAIITALKQQTMSFYMNIGKFYTSDLGRRLFAEISMLEEQHLTHYGSLLDANATWLEGLVLHEYAECYVYYSLILDESDEKIKKIWKKHLQQEISHLQLAEKLLNEYEKKHFSEIFGDGEMPQPIAFNRNAERNREYIRNILKKTINNTGFLESYVKITDLPDNAEFFRYNKAVNGAIKDVLSHKVVKDCIIKDGCDYRFQIDTHPVKELADRAKDNTEIGRIK